MTAKKKDIWQERTPGTLEGLRPGESLDEFEKRVGDDIPEATDEDFARARPLSDFPELAEALANARARRGDRGPQKAPVKERIGLRLDKAVVEHFRAMGPGWQSRINDILAAHIRHER
jgi:uncharacterized protein (DUF4415 family)